MTCTSCNRNCGNGQASVRPPQNSDPIYVALCRTLCEVRRDFCRDPDRYRNTTQAAEGERRARNDPRLRNAIQNHSDPRIRGGGSEINRQRYVRYDNMPRSWNRTRVDPGTIQRHLDNVERQIRNRSAQALATRAGRAAARSWLKLVPVLNVISTAYDVYDIGSLGVETYQQIRQARQNFTGDVYRVRPDVAVTGPNGQVQAIYDFKFDGDSPAPGQTELYDRLLEDSDAADQSTNYVDSQTCGCDGPPDIRRAGAVG